MYGSRSSGGRNTPTTFTFEGDTLRGFLVAFFAEYDVKNLLIAETEVEATAHGWAKPPAKLPSTWRKIQRVNRHGHTPACASTAGSMSILTDLTLDSKTVIVSHCCTHSCFAVE